MSTETESERQSAIDRLAAEWFSAEQIRLIMQEVLKLRAGTAECEEAAAKVDRLNQCPQA